MKNVIGYIRVSTNHQDLERQKSLIKRYCEEKGFLLVRIIEDFAISGAETNRKGYLELQTLTSKSADMIVVSELSRLSRDADVMATLNVIYALIAKFDLVLLDDLNNVYEKGAKLEFIDFMVLAFKAYGAADERKKITERMKTGRDVMMGNFPLMTTQSNMPFGFSSIPNPDFKEKGKGVPMSIMVPNEDMKWVQLIFEWTAEGLSMSKVQERLAAYGFKGINGNGMKKQFVGSVLHNPLYKGFRRWKGRLIKTGVEYISPDLWDAAQLKIKEGNSRANKFTKNLNPVKGLLKCPCGCGMQIIRQSEKCSFSCNGKVDAWLKKKERTCKFKGVRATNLLGVLWHEVRFRILDSEYKAKSNEVIDRLNKQNLLLFDNIEKINNDIETAKSEQLQIISNIASSTNALVVMKLNEMVDSIDQKINKLNDEIASTNREITKNKIKIKNEQKSQTIKELDSITLEAKQKIYNQLLERIVYVSTEDKIGFMVVTYKNGIEVIYVLDCRIVVRKRFYALPLGFSFNPETKKISVPYLGDNVNKFNLQENVKEYSASEVLDNFEIKDWDRTESIQFINYDYKVG